MITWTWEVGIAEEADICRTFYPLKDYCEGM